MALLAGSVDNWQRKPYLFTGPCAVCKPRSVSHTDLLEWPLTGGRGAAEPPTLDSASIWHQEEFGSQAIFQLTIRVMYDQEFHYSRKAVWEEHFAVRGTIISECSFTNSLKIRCKQLETFTENEPN